MATSSDRLPVYVTPPKAGALLGVKADTIIALIKSGRLPALDTSRPGSRRPRLKISLDSLQALAVRPTSRDRRRRGAGAEPAGKFF